MSYPLPSNVGYYAVARDRGRTVAADGPHDPSDAVRVLDAVVRRLPGLPAFATFGVVRLTVAPDRALPVMTS